MRNCLPIVLLLLSARAGAQDAGVRIFKEASGAVAWVETWSPDSLHYLRGSGVVVKSRNWLVTNFHLWAYGGTANARLGRTPLQLGRLVCADADRDVLVWEVLGTTPAEAWRHVPSLATEQSNTLQPGQDCYAVGNPRGVELTIAHGLLSGIRPHTADTSRKLLQFSAPISQGNSGGALLDARGKLIGIPTVRFNDGGGQALNFALPWERVLEAVALGRNDVPPPDAAWMRAWTLFRAKRYPDAIDAADEVAVGHGPHRIDATYLLARCMHLSGDLNRARAAYELVLSEAPTYAKAYYRLAELAMGNGDVLRSLELKGNAVRLDAALAERPPQW